MRRKTIALFTALLLCVLPTVSAMALTMAGYDGEDSNHSWTENLFFQRMQDRTGLSFELRQYNKLSQWQAAKDTMFATGELPDVLFKAALTQEELIRYSDSGQLIDLAPLLEQYAPNFHALLLENPEWKKAITLPSGKIAALPKINPLPLENAMWINQTWLDTLGLEKPTDMDSLISVLTAFRDKDPNRNNKDDEVPLSFLGPWDLKFLGHAFGLIANDYNIYADEAGTVHFMPLDDQFPAFLAAMASLYAQGLLDEKGFVNADALRTVSDSDAAVTYGMFFGPNPFHLLPLALGEQFTVLQPLVYEGRQVYRDIFGPITTGTFAITSACENPEEVLSWVDILYSPQGAREAMAGVEGEDYTWNDSGTWQYALDLEGNSSYILYDLSVYDTGNMPWLFPLDFYIQYDIDSLRDTTQALIGLQDYIVSPFPYYYVLSQEQREYIDPLQLSLATYVDESIARFVTGELDITSAEVIAAFYDGLAARGVDEFVAFWQDIYDSQSIR